MKEPMLRAWVEDPALPRAHHAEKPGRWVAEEAWPSIGIALHPWRLEPGSLVVGPHRRAGEVLTIRSPETIGSASGAWCPYGTGYDQATDQRAEAGGSLLFDTPALAEDIEILGAPIVELELSADRPNAKVACTLSEIMPDGAVTRVTYGLLNLTHRESHERPTPLVPGQRYKVKVQLNDAGHRFAVGNRLRLAVSTAYWPTSWPSPESATVSIATASSALFLPVRPKRAEDATLPRFGDSEGTAPLKKTYLETPRERRRFIADRVSGKMFLELVESDGRYRIDDIDLTVSIRKRRRFTIRPDDPNSAHAEIYWHREYSRGPWRVSAESNIVLTSDSKTFRVNARLDAYEGDNRVFCRDWDERIPRELV
jgi:predicted acyl esterase